MRSSRRGLALIVLALTFWAGFGLGLGAAAWLRDCRRPACPCTLPCDCAPCDCGE